MGHASNHSADMQTADALFDPTILDPKINAAGEEPRCRPKGTIL
jgi:hypothetical protein